MTPPSRRIVILRTSRDTLVLVASTVCVTLALAYAVRRHPEAPVAAPEQKVWAGQLAEVAPAASAPTASEPMSSASLVVPKAELALPPVPPAPAVARSAKVAACETQPCPARPPAPPARQKLALAETGNARMSAEPAAVPPRQDGRGVKPQEKRFGLSDLNPLPHLPDAVRKPFSYAGAKITGWMDWF